MIFYAKERKERKEAQVVVVSLNDLYSIVLEYAVCDDPHSIHTTEQWWLEATHDCHHCTGMWMPDSGRWLVSYLHVHVQCRRRSMVEIWSLLLVRIIIPTLSSWKSSLVPHYRLPATCQRTSMILFTLMFNRRQFIYISKNWARGYNSRKGFSFIWWVCSLLLSQDLAISSIIKKENNDVQCAYLTPLASITIVRESTWWQNDR